MKKLVISLTVLSLLTCSAFSCGSKNSSSSIEEETSLSPEEEAEEIASLQAEWDELFKKAEEAEAEAKKELSAEAEKYFNAFYSHNYSALLPLAYPQKIADSILEKEWYKNAFDEGTGSEANSNESSFPEYEYIITVDDYIEPEEEEKIIDRWNKMADLLLPGNYEYNISWGFNFTVTITSNNSVENKREIKARAVKVSDEGWKIIDEG
ncbi:MAG: hypothetical protein GXY08_13615, partial [Ruminococcus sp.]|nr:hypothetical protein [Ruminococcus sp.]